MKFEKVALRDIPLDVYYTVDDSDRSGTTRPGNSVDIGVFTSSGMEGNYWVLRWRILGRDVDLEQYSEYTTGDTEISLDALDFMVIEEAWEPADLLASV